MNPASRNTSQRRSDQRAVGQDHWAWGFWHATFESGVLAAVRRALSMRILLHSLRSFGCGISGSRGFAFNTLEHRAAASVSMCTTHGFSLQARLTRSSTQNPDPPPLLEHSGPQGPSSTPPFESFMGSFWGSMFLVHVLAPPKS